MSSPPSRRARREGAIARLDALERALVAAGFPAMSRWWRRTLLDFYASGRRTLVLRVGRRGGKSSTLARIAVLEALYGDHVVPPGDIGIVGIVSVSRDEASQRLRTIRAILDALTIKYRPIDGGIELVDRRIAFKVFAASISGVVGGTWICAICDEVARWRDADTGANPASEVLGSLRPTMATMPSSRLFLSSSPLGKFDAHYDAFELGLTSMQMVAHAPTWTANPTITEEHTRALEPDDRIWQREYAAIPQAGALSAFDAEQVERAFCPRASEGLRGTRIMVVDFSSGRKDAVTWAECGWVLPDEGPAFLQFAAIDGVEGRFWGEITGTEIVERIVRIGEQRGVADYHGDQRESLMLTAEFRKHNVRYVVHDWTAASKPPAVELVRRWMREGVIALPEHATLRRELLTFEERLSPTGQFTFAARGSGHDDYVALLVTAAMAHDAGHLPIPSNAPPRARKSIQTFRSAFSGWGDGVTSGEGGGASARLLINEMGIGQNGQFRRH